MSKRRLTTVLLVVVLAGLIVLAVLVPLSGKQWSAISAVATAVAAIASLLSARASGQSARESAYAATQAIRALSYAAKPSLVLHIGERNDVWSFVAENVTTHRVAQIEFSWRANDRWSPPIEFAPMEGMTLTYQGMKWAQTGVTQKLTVPTDGSVDPEQVTGLRVVYAGTTGPTRWTSEYRVLPGERTPMGIANLNTRPTELVEHKELDSGAPFVFNQHA